MPAILFDLDGTLIHSLPTFHATGNQLLSELGRPPIALAGYHRFVGRGVRVQVAELLDSTGGIPGGDVEPHYTRYAQIYDADPLTGTTVYPGVPDMLIALKEVRLTMAVITQKPEAAARHLLEALGLLHHFATVTGGDTFDVLKPDPKTISKTLQRLGMPAAAFVGDSLTDAQTAQAAGLPFLLFTGGYRDGAVAHDGAFDHHADCPALISELMARVP